MNEADVNVIHNCPLIQILEAQKEIHVAIGNMLRCLREVTAKALASCGVRPIPGALLACRRIIKVAGKSAEVVDRWIHSGMRHTYTYITFN